MSSAQREEVVIATVYGVVGHVVHQPGMRPGIVLKIQKSWEDVAETINRAISAEEALTGDDGVARVIGKEATVEEVMTVGTALSDESQGDLFLVPVYKDSKHAEEEIRRCVPQTLLRRPPRRHQVTNSELEQIAAANPPPPEWYEGDE